MSILKSLFPSKKQTEDVIFEDFENEEDIIEEIDGNKVFLQDESIEEEIIDIEVDLYEDEDNLYMKAFAPGTKADGISVSLSREQIIISGERFNKNEVNKEGYYQKEIRWGKFSKSIPLPKEIDIDGIKSSNKDGVLSLILPKADKERTIKLKV